MKETINSLQTQMGILQSSVETLISALDGAVEVRKDIELLKKEGAEEKQKHVDCWKQRKAENELKSRWSTTIRWVVGLLVGFIFTIVMAYQTYHFQTHMGVSKRVTVIETILGIKDANTDSIVINP